MMMVYKIMLVILLGLIVRSQRVVKAIIKMIHSMLSIFRFFSQSINYVPFVSYPPPPQLLYGHR